MKITHNKVGQNLNISDGKATEKTDLAGKAKGVGAAGVDAKSSKAESSDATKVSLSSRAQELKKVKDMVGSIDEVDEAKVAKFQQLIDAGKYKVDADKIADKMVDEHLLMS